MQINSDKLYEEEELMIHSEQMQRERALTIFADLKTRRGYSTDEEAFLVAFTIHGSGGAEQLGRDHVRFLVGMMIDDVPMPAYVMRDYRAS